MATKSRITRFRRTQDHGTRGTLRYVDEYERFLDRQSLEYADRNWLQQTLAEEIDETMTPDGKLLFASHHEAEHVVALICNTDGVAIDDHFIDLIDELAAWLPSLERIGITHDDIDVMLQKCFVDFMCDDAFSECAARLAEALYWNRYMGALQSFASCLRYETELLQALGWGRSVLDDPGYMHWMPQYSFALAA